ncbi:MAG: ACT domain-containing protein, partial [Candidatus Nitrosocosmicus sp.]
MTDNQTKESKDLQNPSNNAKTLIEITIVGKDKKGIVADITNYIFKNGGNIEKINQNVVKGLFGMHLEASFQRMDKSQMKKELDSLSISLDMEIKVHFHEENKIKNVAIFVS